MSAERHVTPRLLVYLEDAHRSLPEKRRVNVFVLQIVLRASCRWACLVDEHDHGRWWTDSTVEQVAVLANVKFAQAKVALANLESIGLIITMRRGGAPAGERRGSLRHLILDPVDHGDDSAFMPAQLSLELGGVRPAEFAPTPAVDIQVARMELGGVRPAEFQTELGGVTPRTRRGNTANSAGSALPLCSSPVSYLRDSTSPPQLRPDDVLPCPNRPAGAWCGADCPLCHGMHHVHAEQLGAS